MNDEPKTGSPSRTISEWLLDFANTNEAEAYRCFWPWNRSRYKGRAAAYRSAARMVKNAYNGNTTFPITLNPGESVELVVPIAIGKHST